MNIVVVEYVFQRDVAQPGRALRSGRRGRKFKSCHPEFVSCFISTTYRLPSVIPF